jgi:hypothetical protein
VFFNQPVILATAGRRSQLQAGEKGGEFSVERNDIFSACFLQSKKVSLLSLPL